MLDFDFDLDLDAGGGADLDVDAGSDSELGPGVVSMFDVDDGSRPASRKRKVLTSYESILLRIQLGTAFGLVAGMLLWVVLTSVGLKSPLGWLSGAIILAFSWAFGSVFWRYFRRGRFRAWLAIVGGFAFNVFAVKAFWALIHM